MGRPVPTFLSGIAQDVVGKSLTERGLGVKISPELYNRSCLPGCKELRWFGE